MQNVLMLHFALPILQILDIVPIYIIHNIITKLICMPMLLNKQTLPTINFIAPHKPEKQL